MKSKNYKDVASNMEESLKTKNEKIDSFISCENGFVVGSSIFLTGTPGAGKTTFAVVLQNLLKDHKTSLYSREMSSKNLAHQVRRYLIDNDNAFISDVNDCASIYDYIKELDEIKPSLVIVDSLQVIAEEDFPGETVESACMKIIDMLDKWAKTNDAVLIVVGRVTKEGEFEGKNKIPHKFDAHLEMIYNKKTNTRTMSWAKNRKGKTDTVLHYAFGENTLEFYTEEEWNNKENKINIVELLFNNLLVNLKAKINSIEDKEVVVNVGSEFEKEISNLYEKKESDMDFLIDTLRIYERISEKYNF